MDRASASFGLPPVLENLHSLRLGELYRMIINQQKNSYKADKSPDFENLGL